MLSVLTNEDNTGPSVQYFQDLGCGLLICTMKHRKYSKIKFVHRNLHLDKNYNYQRGADIEALQKAINHRAKYRGLNGIKVDGVFGRSTLAKGRQIAWSLGIGRDHKKPGLPVYVQHLIRHPELRTPGQKYRGDKWVAQHPKKPPAPSVNGNTVTGGSARERLVAGAHKAAELSASGARHSFYSQAGSWTVERGITGESQGERSDCSQWVTSIYHSAGLKDPNGTSYTGGYTGTLGAHGRRISRDQLQPGDLVLYGTGNFHHVEMYVGPGNVTIGHGSPPVDPGDIYMIAQPNFFTYDLG